MRFGEVVTAVASLVVITIVLESLLLATLVRAIPEGIDIGGILSFLVASLIVGFVFAPQIQEESKRKAIGQIAILSAVVFMFFALALFANPLASPAIREHISGAFSTAGWTNDDWLTGIVMVLRLSVVLALLSTFVGLYVGSMLRRQQKI